MVKEFSSFPNRLVRTTPAGNHVLHAPQSVFWRPTCVCLRRKLLLPASPCQTACSSWEMTHGRGCAASWPRPSAPPKWRRWDVNVSVNMRIFTTRTNHLAPSPYDFSDKCLCLLHCAADGPPHQHSQRRPDEKPECLRRVRRILWHLQVIFWRLSLKHRLTLDYCSSQLASV